MRLAGSGNPAHPEALSSLIKTLRAPPLRDTEVVLLPQKSPNLNAYMERWFRSLKSESLNRIIFFGKRSLERAVAEYVEHYHAERNHQGLQNSLIEPDQTTGTDNGTIDCRERLGGMLKYYHRRAA